MTLFGQYPDYGKQTQPISQRHDFGLKAKDSHQGQGHDAQGQGLTVDTYNAKAITVASSTHDINAI